MLADTLYNHAVWIPRVVNHILALTDHEILNFRLRPAQPLSNLGIQIIKTNELFDRFLVALPFLYLARSRSGTPRFVIGVIGLITTAATMALSLVLFLGFPVSMNLPSLARARLTLTV